MSSGSENVILSELGVEDLMSWFSKGACPDEATLLSFYEGGLSERQRAKLERHLMDCNDCCELLAALSKGQKIAEKVEVSEVELKRQVARVLNLIAQQEASKIARPGALSFWPRLALAATVLIALAVSFYAGYKIVEPQLRHRAAMELIRQAVASGRHTAARISGGMPYSEYVAIRGEQGTSDIQLERALARLKLYRLDSASAKELLILARIYLARGGAADQEKALAILRGLAESGIQSAEVANDLGVALFQLGRYQEALAAFNEALERSPNFEEAIFNRALAAEQLGQPEQARQDWERFLSLSNDPGWRREAEQHLNSLK